MKFNFWPILALSILDICIFAIDHSSTLQTSRYLDNNLKYPA